MSQNVPMADIKKNQFEHKTILIDIEFRLQENGEQIFYSVLKKEDNNISQNDFYPVIAQVQGGKKRIQQIRLWQWILQYWRCSRVLYRII